MAGLYIDDIVGVDGGARWTVWVLVSLRKSKNTMTIRLVWLVCTVTFRWPGWDPLLALCFNLWSMIWHHGFVHGYCAVQQGLRPTVNDDKAQQLGHPSNGFFLGPGPDEEHWKCFSYTPWAAANLSINRRQSSLDCSGYRGNEVQNPDFWIEMTHVGDGFTSPNFLFDGEDHRFPQGLITTGSVNSHFLFTCSLCRPWWDPYPVMLQCWRSKAGWLPMAPLGSDQLIASWQLLHSISSP